MANWFYAAGSLCFLVGTIINMLPGHKALTLRDFGQYRQMTPDEAARNHIPLTFGRNNSRCDGG
jgi:hypothetical protein